MAQLMRTDDTFQYAKAGKQLLLVLEALPGNPGGGGGEGVHASMGDAMMACLSVMESKYTFAWARAPLDMCIKELINPFKRKHFGPLQPKVIYRMCSHL